MHWAAERKRPATPAMLRGGNSAGEPASCRGPGRPSQVLRFTPRTPHGHGGGRRPPAGSCGADHAPVLVGPVPPCRERGARRAFKSATAWPVWRQVPGNSTGILYPCSGRRICVWTTNPSILPFWMSSTLFVSKKNINRNTDTVIILLILPLIILIYISW